MDRDRLVSLCLLSVIVAGLLLLAVAPTPAAGTEPIFPFEGIERSRAALNRGLEEKALAFHPLPGRIYNEQKFCLCQANSGHMLLIGFYIVRAGPIEKYGISLTVILPDAKRIFVKKIFDEEDFHVSTEKCSVRAGGSSFEGRYPDYTLHIEDEKATLTLRIHDQVPGWRPGNGRVYFGAEREKFYDFVMANTRATARGTLKLAGVKDVIPIDGMFYSDHCYVNLLPTEQALNWYSLRAFGERISVNYIEFVTPQKYGSRRVPWLVVADDREILYATLDVEQTLARHRIDRETKYEYPTIMGLAVDEPGLRLTADVEALRILDRFDVFADLNPALRFVAKAFFHRPILFRFMSRYRIDLKLAATEERPAVEEVLEGKGMSEVIFVH